LPTAPGHPFYKRLNDVLDKAKFDTFCETACAGFYHLTYAQNCLEERPEPLT
jgi:hypothetical protein